MCSKCNQPDCQDAFACKHHSMIPSQRISNEIQGQMQALGQLQNLQGKGQGNVWMTPENFRNMPSNGVSQRQFDALLKHLGLKMHQEYTKNKMLGDWIIENDDGQGTGVVA